jgi:hypothetical protein
MGTDRFPISTCALPALSIPNSPAPLAVPSLTSLHLVKSTNIAPGYNWI